MGRLILAVMNASSKSYTTIIIINILIVVVLYIWMLTRRMNQSSSARLALMRCHCKQTYRIFETQNSVFFCHRDKLLKKKLHHKCEWAASSGSFFFSRQNNNIIVITISREIICLSVCGFCAKCCDRRFISKTFFIWFFVNIFHWISAVLLLLMMMMSMIRWSSAPGYSFSSGIKNRECYAIFAIDHVTENKMEWNICLYVCFLISDSDSDANGTITAMW